MPLFIAKALPASLINNKVVKQYILRAMQGEGRNVATLMNQTIATWQHPPRMVSRLIQTAPDIIYHIGPEGPDAAKWGYLNYGTRRRWAIMSKNWQSKTIPGRLRAGVGRGRVVLRGKRHMKHPQPGIQARGWDVIIIRIERPRFNTSINRAVREGMKAAREKGKI